MAFRLPPLNTLRLFEAAGRHRSFKLAAEELFLVPSAVSHGIQTLEEWLGAPLFDRGARGLTLTAAGEAYLPHVSAALTLLAQATERLPGRKATGQLSISVAPTFAARWLVSRLSSFTERYPDLVVTLDTSLRKVEFPLHGVDLAIRMGPANKSSATRVHLLREELVPVCSPDLLAKLGAASFEETLGKAALLHVTSVREDWAAWFSAAGMRPPVLDGGIRLDTIQMALEGAIQGLGIALGRRPLVDDDLAAGKLVTLPAPAVQGTTSYWLVGGEGVFDRPEIKQFRTWLLSELEAENGFSASGSRPARAVVVAAS